MAATQEGTEIIMCNTFRRIVSNVIDETTDSREILNFIGCASLKNFVDHLKRSDCKDYEADSIENIIYECKICQIESINREELVKRLPFMSKEELIEYKTKIVYEMEEFNRRCDALNIVKK